MGIVKIITRQNENDTWFFPNKWSKLCDQSWTNLKLLKKRANGHARPINAMICINWRHTSILYILIYTQLMICALISTSSLSQCKTNSKISFDICLLFVSIKHEVLNPLEISERNPIFICNYLQHCTFEISKSTWGSR